MPDARELLSCLRAAEHVPRPENETWTAMIARISSPDKIAHIDEDTFTYFLEVLPPKFQSGNVFAFAEGSEPLRLFWRNDGHFFCRQLSWNETKTFCRFAQVSFPYWF
jgi:hypothetical protein